MVALKVEGNVFERNWVAIDVQRPHALGALVLIQLLLEEVGEVGGT